MASTTQLPDRQPVDRQRSGSPGEVLAVTGASCIVFGGLVAAFTGPLGLADGSWLAAYLVLVCGVAQYAVGRVPPWIGAPAVSADRGWATVVCWNLGNAAVIGGTLAAAPVLVDAGATLLVIGLVLAWRAVRDVDPRQTRDRRWAGWVYRAMLLAMLTGTAVGTVLAHLRHGG